MQSNSDFSIVCRYSWAGFWSIKLGKAVAKFPSKAKYLELSAPSFVVVNKRIQPLLIK